jgi:hypothetical protein
VTALLTIHIDGKPIITMRGDRELLQDDCDLRLHLTTWTVRGKPIWNGDLKRLDIRLATPSAAARFQAKLLDWQQDHPNEEPDEDMVSYIGAPIDKESIVAAEQQLQLRYAPRQCDDNGNLAPFH